MALIAQGGCYTGKSVSKAAVFGVLGLCAAVCGCGRRWDSRPRKNQPCKADYSRMLKQGIADYAPASKNR